MGTLNWTLGQYAQDNNKNTVSSKQVASGAFTTGTSAANVVGASPRAGQLFVVTASEPMWVNFGGRAAAVGTGFYVLGNLPLIVEISPTDEGAVSAIDVS